MISVFWMLSFKPAFSLSSFTFIKRIFSSSSLSAIKVVSSAYLRLLIFLLAVLIPACVSSSPAFHMMYSAYELNKQGDSIQPWRTVRWSGHTVKGFSMVNEAEVDVFQEFPCFLYDPTNLGYLSSGSSAFSKPSLYIWKFSVHVLLKPSLKDFEHVLASMWN